MHRGISQLGGGLRNAAAVLQQLTGALMAAHPKILFHAHPHRLGEYGAQEGIAVPEALRQALQRVDIRDRLIQIVAHLRQHPVFVGNRLRQVNLIGITEKRMDRPDQQLAHGVLGQLKRKLVPIQNVAENILKTYT